jgi:hypothetical protein
LYGNYVVQHVITHAGTEEAGKVVGLLKGR